MALTPYSIPGMSGKPPIAADKDLYTMVFYHEPNISDGLEDEWHFRNELWAEQNSIVRLPRVVRFTNNFTAGDPQDRWRDYYEPMFEDIATLLADDRICVNWGTNNEIGPTASPFVAYAAPDRAETFTPDEIVAGQVLTYYFITASLSYHSSITLVANYGPDYALFTARHPRFQKFKAVIYDPELFVAIDPGCALENMMAGDGEFAQFGPGLSTFGWEHRTDHWTGDLVSQATLMADIEDFFDL